MSQSDPFTPFITEAHAEMTRRGIRGNLDRADLRALVKYQKEGRTSVEAGAQRFMDIMQTV